jgi:catechol 2,3-dioxygenase-like lactoylglutathione lyase family enzyme
VTDVDRSRAFYTEVFGFDVALGGPPPEDPDGIALELTAQIRAAVR